MRLPETVRKRFQAYGREGGRRRARRLSAVERSRIARTAAMIRWIRERFGDTSFERLGLPGGKHVDRGLRDYAAGRPTPEAYVIAIAAPRLRREGVPVPDPAPGWKRRVPDPHMALYRQIEVESGDLAHARYNARQREVVSFADALARARG